MESFLDIALIIALLLGFVVFALVMLAVCLRVGPRRGHWNQPAAALRRPGRRTFLGMYAVAALHVVCGVTIALAVPGAGLGILLVCVATGVFYVLCAHSWSLATGVAQRRQPRPVD